ncbi:TRMT1-like protein isoform X3 [Cricetulus griseus]|uniref:tRNA (guanine(27)-N(2))-dimethyltransferase n=1 Tax=Cricetulus griseus TaxID=10029 RepID=A0A9J7G0Y2_CRIGR|nr:TRMT1-like protein isoform X3 [Cricetulus griseus]XP_027273198.1 TRMT1-like protein isoform X3 [Cricetulus griseus]
MENMAEEELPPQEEEEAQVRVPTPAPDSAPVPAPAADSALDSAPTPDSAPAPALAPAPAPALSPSLASVPEEAESNFFSERHISIQRRLADLEKLALVTEGDDDDGPASSLNSENLGTEKSHTCPLCPKEKFRACSSQKLRRHLQNLHWKISVEFEGYRMCICHLACRPVKPTIVGEQISSKLGAHYHCIICSATITRRTDMLGHVKRHVNKGETKSRYIAASTAKSSNEILKEADTDIQVGPNYSIPQKTDSYFNPKMKLNRQIIFCTLAALAEERKPLECLDAFGATGIMGLQWAKHLGNAVKVTINDLNENSVTLIQKNCHLNKLKVVVDSEEKEEGDALEEDGTLGDIQVTRMDANVLMHLRSFDFIHLDPFGTSVNYLDSAFRNVRNLGIVSVTSTDISSLYAKAQHVARRHYGCNIVRTEYYKELAARIVVAAVARAAARCNKGIEVLFAVALEHFVLVVVRVLRGPTSADETAKKIQYLIHCQWCEERIFQKDGNMVEENPYRQLPCNCHGSMPGKTAIELGPLWSSSLFNTGFLKRMLLESLHHGLDDVQPLIKTLIFESECTPQSQCSVHAPSNLNKQGKRKSSEMIINTAKKQKTDASAVHPPFYYNIHRHSIKGMNMPKLKKFLCCLSQAGFRVSRTHFDPMGIRTDAPLMQFKSILLKYSTPTYTGGQSEGPMQSVSEDTVADRVEMSVADKAEASGCRRW